MTRSPHRSQSGKGEESGKKKEATGEEMAKFKDLAKRLLKVSKEELQHQLDEEKARKR